MKNLRTHGKKKIQWAFIIAAFAVIMLFTACKQFLADPEEFLSYWASESFVEDHNIGSAHKPDDSGVQCVGSSNDADITLSMHNPKNFSFVMPTASAPAGIVEFKDLSVQPQAGTEYELKQTGSGTLKLTYKKDFLEKYEQGSSSLNPTITLKAKDGRVFQKTYTFGIKSNTPPPAPNKIIIAKTKIDAHNPTSYYVLCLKFDPIEMEKMVMIGSKTVPVHKDIKKIIISGTEYTLLYKGVTLGFQIPAETTEMGSFIERGNVQQLTAALPPEQENWVLYFKTEVAVESNHGTTLYGITLIDNKGVVSDSVTAGLTKKFQVEFDVNGGDPTSKPANQYIPNGGTVTMPSPPPTRTGYDFGGWYTDNTSYSTQWDFTNGTVTQDITLYAKWTAASDTPYKVNHYQETVSGGTYNLVGTDNESGTTGANAAYTPKAYEGFTHQSGLTEINGTVQQSGTINADGNTVVKLYYKRNEITVTFNLNGGKIGTDSTSPVERKGKYDAPLTAPTATKSGYTFSGWNPTPPAPALPSTFPAVNAEYTAQWTANTYYVRFNGNGNTDGSMSDQTFTYGQSQQLSANGFIKTGHTFDGWATSAGGSKVYDNQQSVINLTASQNGIVTLYAVWKIETYTVRFSVAGGKGTLKGEYGSQNQIAQNGGGIKTLTNVPYGSTVSFKATAASGWEVESWKVSSGHFASTGGIGAAIATATLTVDSDKTVTVKFKPGELHFNSGGPDAWKRLREEAAKPDGAHTIVINGEITATDDEGNHGKITLGRDLTIMGGSSAVLNANERSPVFEVENGKTLTLKDITLKNGKTGQLVGGGGVYIDDGGTLIMQGSSTITNCKAGKGGGVYVKGTFKMEGSARVDQNNEVYLESGKTVTVTGALTHTPAAKIRVADYQENRVLAVGERAKKENFKLAPVGGNNWRYKKVGDKIKFVTGKLTYTIEKIISIKEHDTTTWAEYYWTMNIDGENVHSLSRDEAWKPKTPTDPTKPRPEYKINSSQKVLFDYTDEKTVGAHFLIKEKDKSPNPDDIVANVTKDIKYKNDQLEFEGETISLDQEKSFRLEFHNKDEGEVDVVCRIRWEDE